MVAPTTPAPVPLVRRRRPAVRPAVNSLRPTWSVPAAYRAARATVVMPGLFALSSQVVGNVQMSTFAAFGGFATLVLASFGGARRDKLGPPRPGRGRQRAARDRDRGDLVDRAGGSGDDPGDVLRSVRGHRRAQRGFGRDCRPARLRVAGGLSRDDEHGPFPPGRMVAGNRRRHSGRPRPFAPAGRRTAYETPPPIALAPCQRDRSRPRGAVHRRRRR